MGHPAQCQQFLHRLPVTQWLAAWLSEHLSGRVLGFDRMSGRIASTANNRKSNKTIKKWSDSVNFEAQWRLTGPSASYLICMWLLVMKYRWCMLTFTVSCTHPKFIKNSLGFGLSWFSAGEKDLACSSQLTVQRKRGSRQPDKYWHLLHGTSLTAKWPGSRWLKRLPSRKQTSLQT